MKQNNPQECKFLRIIVARYHANTSYTANANCGQLLLPVLLVGIDTRKILRRHGFRILLVYPAQAFWQANAVSPAKACQLTHIH